ncbi:DASH complex subunit DAD4 [Aspergillus affinis]|uniref:DASH complex subunit DAD4 n=1 Tax=Aspergillus affinis TaxID=1070780 RepID=UPI0022FE644D|nr:uncharacterized protein KD926_004415 [Aspergillus affinis]KAI9043231.1 hypothetical protein KD926_004415 [Aspergillus affinis]
MESPHEHQQALLLQRIINNIVYYQRWILLGMPLLTNIQEKLNESVMVMNKSLQEVNIQNMNVELVAQMFKNYQSNVLFHLEATENFKESS